MSYRRFLDSRGTLWRVWEVFPRLDRRRAHRRVLATKVQHPERRVLPDRRLDMRRSRLFFPPSESTWLVFETDAEKRRLWPVPAGWYLEDDAGLERLREEAEVQARTGRD
ncbi:MAG TPA: hypothetical protein VF263_10810 [Longimicrobiaceae bacterium]